MHRLLSHTLQVLAASMLIGNLALSQNEGPGSLPGAVAASPGGNGAVILVNIAKIQKELRLTEEQVRIVQKLEDEWVAAFREVFALPPEEREKRAADSRKKAVELDEKVKSFLTAEQSARLRQIQLWMGGVAFLASDEEGAKAVKLADMQQTKIKMIVEEYIGKRAELGKGLRGASREEQAKIREQMMKLPGEAETACRAILTDEQMTRLDELRGPKFEFDDQDMLRAQRESRERRRGRN
jgi:hypothetical protein